MYRYESLKLFNDISKISNKYKSWTLKKNSTEVKYNRILKESLNYHNSRINHIKEKYDFLSNQTKNELKNKSKDELHKILDIFNNFSYKQFLSLKNIDIESTTVKAVMLSTIDELSLINESIRKKEYLKKQNLYFDIYEQVALYWGIEHTVLMAFLMAFTLTGIEAISIKGTDNITVPLGTLIMLLLV